mgnify:FL=1
MPNQSYDAWLSRSPYDDEIPSGFLCCYCACDLIVGTTAVRNLYGDLFHSDCWLEYCNQAEDSNLTSLDKYAFDCYVTMIEGGYD